MQVVLSFNRFHCRRTEPSPSECRWFCPSTVFTVDGQNHHHQNAGCSVRQPFLPTTDRTTSKIQRVVVLSFNRFYRRRTEPPR
eukprot:scaffold131_cov154-Amphora_coffeaeformis.AAC.5